VLHRAENTQASQCFGELRSPLGSAVDLRENQKLNVSNVIFLEQKEISLRRKARADETDNRKAKRRVETQIKSEICSTWWKHCKMLTMERVLCVFRYSLVIFRRPLSFLCAENLAESNLTNLRS
jgi:hypothetical protein